MLLANQGVLCCGRSLEEALLANRLIERAALIMLAAGGREKEIPFPEELGKLERRRFLYKTER